MNKRRRSRRVSRTTHTQSQTDRQTVDAKVEVYERRAGKRFPRTCSVGWSHKRLNFGGKKLKEASSKEEKSE
jgi:hypothetical protein